MSVNALSLRVSVFVCICVYVFVCVCASARVCGCAQIDVPWLGSLASGMGPPGTGW